MCAIICVDEINDNIGFVSVKDSNLKKILNYIVELPFLVVRTGDKINSSCVEMNEHVDVKDKRFMQVMNSYLNEYQFTDSQKHEGKTLNEVLNELNNLRN